MARPIQEPATKEWSPSANDRCDFECPAQAMVLVRGVSGEIYLCSHHYNKVLASASGKAKLEAFSFEVQDKSDVLVENKSKGHNL